MEVDSDEGGVRIDFRFNYGNAVYADRLAFYISGDTDLDPESIFAEFDAIITKAENLFL